MRLLPLLLALPSTLTASSVCHPAHAPLLRARRVSLVASAEQAAGTLQHTPWEAFKTAPPWKQHDLVNLAVLPVIIALVVSSFLTVRARLPLTLLLIAQSACHEACAPQSAHAGDRPRTRRLPRRRTLDSTQSGCSRRRSPLSRRGTRRLHETS